MTIYLAANRQQRELASAFGSKVYVQIGYSWARARRQPTTDSGHYCGGSSRSQEHSFGTKKQTHLARRRDDKMIIQQWFATFRPTLAFSTLSFVAAMAISPHPAAAHHSFAPLRTATGEDVVEIYDGVVDTFKLLNPHTALILNLENEDGSRSDWLIEMSSSATLAREGWTDDSLVAGEQITVAVMRSQAAQRGRLRAILVHPNGSEPGRLFVLYGIGGDTPIMHRLQERLPLCGTVEATLDRSQCFSVDAAALKALTAEFPGKMGYVMP